MAKADEKKAKQEEGTWNLPTYTLGQALEFIRHNLRLPPEKARTVVLIGQPGVGKTRGISELVRELSYSLVVLHLGQTHPLEMACIGIDPASREMYFAKPAVWSAVMAMPAPRVLFADEFDRISGMGQSAMLQLFQDRMFNRHKLEDTYVLGAGNAWHAQYSFELDNAFASRLVMVHVREDHEEWLRWGAAHGIHESILITIARAPDILNQHGEMEASVKRADPRAWEALSDALRGGVPAAHAACFVGEHAARTFHRYANLVREYQKEIEMLAKGKRVEPKGETEAEKAGLLFALYLAAAGRVEQPMAYTFLTNAQAQMGNEKAYVVGRVLSYHIEPRELILKDARMRELHDLLYTKTYGAG